ncbi:hypothetical protein [Corynebacterium sp.]|uniref:hypothetical protein n=1 Tax=Corynebacterium sp. TaxID=1720 RepID=UPI0026DD2168|nr:hypothetical protein [Corynebacterium sp.]MDO4611074.1 hypothetical protein [Corynebacterium sp.]
MTARPLPWKAAAAASTTLLLLTAGCSSSPEEEWPNEQVRNIAFHEYACKRMETDDPSHVASSAIATIPTLTDADAGDRAVALRHASMVSNGVKPTCDISSTDYDYTFARAWQKYLEETEGADFTPAVAREHGVDFFD